MIIGGFAAGVRILLEKGPSRHLVSEDQKIPEKYQKIIFRQKTEGARRRRCGEATLAHYCHRPFAYIIVPENLSQWGSEIDAAASAGRKIPEREKLSGRQESAGEIPSRRGKIIAIVITIALDFIGIIITIILITSTFIFTITTPSHCNILG
jgi:hypothetical protein